MNQDRREFSRVKVPMWARVLLPDRVLEGPATDVSMNGLFLGVAQDVRPGELGTLVLALGEEPNRLELQAVVEVVRICPGGVGLRIAEVELESYRHLRQLLLHNADEPRTVEQEIEAHIGLRRG